MVQATLTPKSLAKSRRRKMVRKQIYIHPQQDTKLKELADRQHVTEAELIRQAVDILLDQPTTKGSNALPMHEAAWQEILAFVGQLEQNMLLGEPYTWSRADGYSDERALRGWNTLVNS